MDRGIWAIWYDIADNSRTEYLDWFHHVHIPEKLSRPGYRWAAHYALGHGGRGQGYLALFGGDTTQTFLNPSPGQLATRQSAETKKFITMRIKATAGILAEEARVDGPDAGKRGPGPTAAPVVQIGHYNAPSPAVEDDLGGWYAQQRFPLLTTLPGCVGARKMLATVGSYKHAILHEFSSLELREQNFAAHEAERDDPNTWMGRVVPQLIHAPYSPAVGCRIWPTA
ncbi:MAG: hypothetical protein ACO1PN_05845 [Betaproteobacteria bacterium]